MNEELRLSRRLWKAFYNLGEPDIFQILIYQNNPEKSRLSKIAFNNAKAKYKECISELAESLIDLEKISPDIEVVQQFVNGNFELEDYQSLLDNMPVTFGLVDDFKYKKKYVAVELNFKIYNIKTEIYTFLLHIKSKKKETWNYKTEIEYLQEKNIIKPEYFRIGDLFKNNNDKEIQKRIISRVGKSTYKLNVDIWY